MENRHYPISGDRVGLLSQSSESHERTDERTDVEGGTGDQSSADRNARASKRGLPTDRSIDIDVALAVIAAHADGPHRYPVMRTGEREPISWPVRQAIWLRDQDTCQLCGRHRPRPWHLDHVTPWSAGGCDCSQNLRLTCEPCNRDRSNYCEPTQSRVRRSATWWCAYCWTAEGQRCHHERYACMPRVPTHLGYGWYHDMPPVDPDRANVFAFCAHCDSHGYTEQGFLL